MFVRTDFTIIAIDEIADIDCTQLDALFRVTVTMKNGSSHVATKIHALELLMQTLPSMLEGRPWLKWERHVWSVHNLIGHPLMQIFAFFKLYKIAFWLHDHTVPRPRALKHDV